MGSQWNPFGFQLHRVSNFVVLMLLFHIHECQSLNLEGLTLLEFRANVDNDPNGVFENWNPNDSDPCIWIGVHCVDGKVQILDLKGFSLEGTLAPELGNLNHLRSLYIARYHFPTLDAICNFDFACTNTSVLYENHFTGVIPKEIGGLTNLEILDLRANDLSGTIPAELGQMQSLKHLLLCNNKFHGSIPPELGKLNMLSEIQFDQNLSLAFGTGIRCPHRKLGHCVWQKSLKQLKKADSFMIPSKGTLLHYLNVLPLFYFRKGSLHVPVQRCCHNLPSSDEPLMERNVQHRVHFVRRKLLQESKNLPAAPASSANPPEQMTTIPSTRSSGAFPAVPNAKKKQFPPPLPPTPGDQSTHQSPSTPNSNAQSSQSPTGGQPVAQASSWKTMKFIYVVPGVAFLLTVAAAMLCMCRKRGVTTIGPWKTGLSGQLQKAFVTGVPKLNRSELETACEDFSNIIDTLDDCTVFKGTLSSGVEIAVASTLISSSKDWTDSSEMAYRKKIDTLSRVNHKNYVNLLGFCEEDEPFLRMMVFEYAPNGTLFEHLHVKEVEHLDWNARVRIIMGTAYCLQYMHHELNPPIAHPNLQSQAVYLTDDYAAKIGDISFCTNVASKSKNSSEDESKHSTLPPFVDPETNIYSFGILLLEIITGKLPLSEEHGLLINWASEYLNDNQSINSLVDPTLKSVKNNELDIICEVIKDCIHQDPTQRPTIKEIITKLREVIAISPDAATPRLSPLWWAELEILSVEAT
ncbi:Protein kinase domain [Macleaya cordata]|uniref:Protein kinase domain n=1 Tax=Macleaya cordata TaxID=56857 RepID=A0A200PV55_MACCD|nr:Protein kinase domain [Macleaya cordata]